MSGSQGRNGPGRMRGMTTWTVLLAGLVVACSTSGLTATVEPTPSSEPTGPVPIKVGLVDPGVTYTTTVFEPTLTFHVLTDGWVFFFPDDDDEMAVGKGDVELLGGRVSKVVDPTTHQPIEAPDDLIGWLDEHPGFEADAPEAATVDGRDARSIDIRNPSDTDVDVWAYPTGNARVAADTDARIWVIPMDGPDLVFTALATADAFDASVEEMATILESLQITDS